jgi:hypothetical protein
MSKRITVKVTVKGAVKGKGKGKALGFGKGNSKLHGKVHTFSLPSGWACPFARDCMAKSDPDTGRISDGPHTEFRCFSASDEAYRPSVRKARWRNFRRLRGKTSAEMVGLILESLPRSARTVRVHVAGDFFSQAYFDAWLEVARQRPEVTLYCYTKSVRYWLERLADVGDGHTPGAVANFIPTASKGGKDDALIEAHGLRWARVVYSEAEAARLGLSIDHDDSHPQTHGPDFALLIHGMQPGGSEAAQAVQALREDGEFGYGKRADAVRVAKGRLPLALAGN